MAFARATVRQVPEPFSGMAFVMGLANGVRENKPYAFLRDWHLQHGSLLKVNMLVMQCVSVTDAQAVKWVSRNDPARFTKGNGYDMIKRGWLDNTLVVNEDDEWRRKRTIYNRAFKLSAIRSYVPLFFDIAEAAALRWQQQCHKQEPIDAVRSFEAIALEAIGRAGFGVDGMGESDNAYGHAFVAYLDMLQDEITSPAMMLLPRSVRKFVTRLRTRRYLETMNSESRRISSGQSGSDSLESGASQTRRHLVSLIKEAAAEENSVIDSEQLAREANLFLFAGHDTTSATLAWVFASLAAHPEVQQRAYEEVASVPTDQLVEHVADPRSLPFLAAVIRETLRLYPPAPMVMRRTKFDEELGGHEIPSGTNLSINIWCMHRDPQIFQEPDVFKPDRWIDSTAEDLKAMQDHWMPFMTGARSCIGQQFSLMEIRIVCATLLRRFSVRLASEPKLKQRMLLLPSSIMLQCTER